LKKQPDKVIKLNIESLSLLELCANIEMKCAEVYRYFAEFFADVPELSALWRKTANEEDDHAEQFKLAGRLWGAGMQNIKADHLKIQLIIEKLNVLLPSLKKSNPTPKQALMFAIQMEEKLAEYHMSTLIDFADTNVLNLFKTMAKNDVGHIEMLQNALKEITAN
jgi:rubrerythrin